MCRSERHIVLTKAELETLLARAAARGYRAAKAPFISRRRAELEYGRSVISNLIESGLVEGHRQGAAANSKVLFSREEIERAIMG